MPSDDSASALAGGSDGEREATYVGTFGGTPTAGAVGTDATATTTDNALAGAGKPGSLSNIKGKPLSTGC